jgi:hypothetical protein
MNLRLLPLPLAIVLLAACSTARIERYYQAENAPDATTADGVAGKLLYFKQSMRHFYATVRLTNTGTTPLVLPRSGPQAAQIQLLAEGRTLLADPPTSATWTPWTGVVEQDPTKLARVEIAPGAHYELSLRWEFPQTTTTYRFAWQVVIKGLVRGEAPSADLVIPAPADN